MRVVLKKARLAFPSLFKASKFSEDQDAKFSAMFLVDKEDPQAEELQKAMVKVAKDKWGDEAASIFKSMKAKGKLCVKDGEEKSEYEGFEDCVFMSASSKTKPQLKDRDRSDLNEEDGKLYAGCYVNGYVEMWAMDNKYGKRICADLKGVQKHSDGPAFSGSAPMDDDEFEDLSVGDTVDTSDDDMFA